MPPSTRSKRSYRETPLTGSARISRRNRVHKADENSESQTSPIPQYQYEPLPHAGSIRLLLLHPGNKNDPIACSLIFEDTKSKPSYEAISYVWSNSNNRTSITCNGKSMFITVNLWTALQRFRLPKKARRLWADAICINQQNIEERGHQVTMMGAVYERAEKVLIWLGPDEKGGAEECFKLIGAIMDEVDNLMRVYGSLTAIPPHRDVDSLENLPWASLDRMLRLPWFSRLWVIQEVLLATSALVCYGDIEFTWTDLLLTVMFLVLKMPSLYWRLSRAFHVLIIDSIRHLSRSENGLQNSRDRIAMFLNILYSGQRFEASDAKDHVYALMGLANARLGVGTIAPTDYTLSIQQTFEMVATRAMAKMENLYFLSFVHHTKDTLQDHFPSWVPQWHQPTYCVLLENIFYTKLFYDADAGSSFCCDGVTAAGMLHLRGLMFDVTSSCFDMFCGRDFDTLVAQTGQDVACDLVKSILAQTLSADLDLIYPQTDRSKAVSLTLVGGCRSDMDDVEKDDLHRHLADFAAYVTRIGVVDHEDRTTAEQKLQPQEDTEGGNWYRFEVPARTNCVGRKLFVTQKGYLGLGPGVLEEGDFCCVLYGAKTPFILRRVEDHYLLIGQSYIYGIMRGEAMEMLRNGELEEEVFNIQ